ncbi:FHA domain-containing protein [Streptosporangium sp. DT93]|uniref:FHA domain-containing protein n=1 Tax=Streptosporangium sp. DT93 TaxID=3393428 RepID=UPI003CEBB371
MTDQGFGVVRPLPGNGLVAHVGGLLLVCDAAEAVVEDLLGALRETAGSGGDGRALARRVAQILAVMMGEPVACAVAGPVGGGVAVLVSGPAFASVTGSAGEVQLAGRDALTWSDRLVPGPVSRVELRLPEAGSAHPLSTLDAGVIVAGGVECDLTAVPSRAPAPPRTESAASAASAASAGSQARHVAPQMQPAAPEPTPMPAPPERAEPPQWSAPSQTAPPYPMGQPESAPPRAVPPPVEPRPERQQPPPQPVADRVPPAQQAPPGPAAGAGPSRAGHEDIDTALSSGMGGDPIGVDGRPFEYELLTPDGPRQADERPPAVAEPEPEPEARPLVYGVDCKNDHFNDPRVPYCAVCGIALVQRTLVPYKGPRPPLGVLLLDDGLTLRLDTDYLVGRDPERAPEVADGSVRPAKVTSPDGSVSRRHLRVALDNWDVNLVDLGSVNGTQIQPPGDPNFYDIPPNEPVAIMPGTTVRIGVSRTMRYESHRNR